MSSYAAWRRALFGDSKFLTSARCTLENSWRNTIEWSKNNFIDTIVDEAYKFALSVKASEEVDIPGPLYLSWFLLVVVVIIFSDVD